MINYLPEVLQNNPVDIVFVPRVNTVEGLTDSHIQKWGWKVNEKRLGKLGRLSNKDL